MGPKSVLRGIWHAYIAAIGAHFVILLGIGIAVGDLTALLLILAIAFVGLILTIPAALVALAILYVMDALRARLRWWSVPPMAIAVVSGAVGFYTQTPEPGILIYTVPLGLITGLGFWHGAVGWDRIVDLGYSAGGVVV